ncbi:hypothetical protein PS3A_21170 [Pseudomonas sp. 3A(2025)]
MNTPVKRVTFDHLPCLSPRPDHACDYTGKQRGKMTAIAWHRPGCSGKATSWLCRCECGRYEYRRPGTWESKTHPDDMCDVCLHARGPNARQTARQRLMQWAHDLRCQGLSDEEITRLQAPGMNVDTKGKTAAEIREQIEKGPT